MSYVWGGIALAVGLVLYYVRYLRGELAKSKAYGVVQKAISERRMSMVKSLQEEAQRERDKAREETKEEAAGVVTDADAARFLRNS